MISCLECKERHYPADPSKPYFVGFSTKLRGVSPFSGCLPPICNSCSNYPGIWGEPTVKESSAVQRHEPLTQLRGQVLYIGHKLDEHLSNSKKRKGYKDYTV